MAGLQQLARHGSGGVIECSGGAAATLSWDVATEPVGAAPGIANDKAAARKLAVTADAMTWTSLDLDWVFIGPPLTVRTP